MSLKDQILADLDSIFDTDELAVSASWEPSGRDAVTINGFFEPSVNVGKGSETGFSKVDSYDFKFTCLYSRAKVLSADDVLTIEGTRLIVLNDPIGIAGFTTILLNEEY